MLTMTVDEKNVQSAPSSLPHQRDGIRDRRRMGTGQPWLVRVNFLTADQDIVQSGTLMVHKH